MQKYTDFEELPIIYRGDDEATMLPYGGVASFRDGRFILASHYRGRLAMVGPDGLVISTCDPLNGHIGYDKLICYGIALHTNEQYLYMLVGEEGSTDLYISTVEIIPALPVGSNKEHHSDPVFHWVPSSDVRLPCVTARSANSNSDESYTAKLTKDCGDIYSYPVLYGFTSEEGPEGEEILEPAGPFYWDIEKREPIDVPDNFVYDDTAYWKWQSFDINKWSSLWSLGSPINSQSLGPILIDYPVYRPTFTGLGSRVMVGCMNAQLFYSNWSITIPYQKIDGGILGDVKDGELRDAFYNWLVATLHKLELINDDEILFGTEQEDIETDDIEGTEEEYLDEGFVEPDIFEPYTDVHWFDVFQEGEDGWWWVDEEAREIHWRMSFQEANPVSSVVTVHPDLGTIDGLFHVSLYYPIQHMFSEESDVTLFTRDVVSELNRTVFDMSDGAFWDASEFKERYSSGIVPTPIDMDFYLRMIEYYLVQYKRYISEVNPLERARTMIREYASEMTWDDPLFTQYATVDEALLSVHAPTFD